MKAFSKLSFCTLLILALHAISPFSIISAQEYVKSDFAVSDPSDNNYHAAQLSVSNAGDMVVVWETTGNGDINLKTISSKGELMGVQKEVATPNSTMFPRVAHNGNGNFMVIFGAYSGNWSVLGQTFTPGGVEIGDTLVVDRNTSEQINMGKSSLRSNQSNQFAAFLPGLDSMIVEMLSANGEFLSNTIVLKPDFQVFYEMYGMMTSSGELILVWLDGTIGNIHGQRYTADGTPIGDVFQVSYKDANSYLSSALLCTDTSGNFAVVWTNTTNGIMDIYSQLFSMDGVAIGGNTRVTDDQADYQGQKKSIDMDLDGNYMVAWPDNRSSDTAFIYLQQMDKLGVPVGNNYRATTVNNAGPTGMASLPDQTEPSVHILRDTIYLAWVNYNEELSYRYSVFANIQEWIIPDATGLIQSDISPADITIYPNPSKGSFSLQLDHIVIGSAEMKIYNSAGMLIDQETIHLNGQIAQIDLPNIKEGIYYLEIQGESLHATIPLIIEK